MQTINESFEDKEMKFLKKIKEECSWHDFILKLAEFYYNHGKIKGKK